MLSANIAFILATGGGGNTGIFDTVVLCVVEMLLLWRCRQADVWACHADVVVVVRAMFLSERGYAVVVVL